MEVKKCQVSASGFLPPHSLLSTSLPPLEGKGKEVCRDTFFILFYCLGFFLHIYALLSWNSFSIDWLLNHAFEHFCCLTFSVILFHLIISKETVLPFP